MNLKNVKKEERKLKTITVRTFPSYSKWMADNKVSPTKVFNEAIKDLMKPSK